MSKDYEVYKVAVLWLFFQRLPKTHRKSKIKTQNFTPNSSITRLLYLVNKQSIFSKKLYLTADLERWGARGNQSGSVVAELSRKWTPLETLKVYRAGAGNLWLWSHMRLFGPPPVAL